MRTRSALARAVLLAFGGLVLLSALLAEAAPAQPAPPRVRSDTVSLRPGGRVEIRTRRGPLHITAWDRPQVAYEVAPAPGRRDAAAERGRRSH